MKRHILLMAIVALLFSSCATLFTGTRDKITFNTNPQGATIYINGVEQCTTPCTLDMKRSVLESEVEIVLDGYQVRYILLDKEFNLVSIWNLGNVFGWAVDAMSGALMKYDRKVYNLNLELDRRLSEMNPSTISINTEEKVVEFYVQAQQ